MPHSPTVTFLGLDIGSSSIKGAVLDLERGQVRDVRSRPFPDPIGGLDPTWFEVDPKAILTGVRHVLDDLLALGHRPSGIVVCGQMGGVILANEALSPATNYLSWRDQRVSAGRPRSTAEELRDLIGEDDLARIGRELKPGGAVSLLFWLAAQGRLPATATRAMGLGEYVVSQLCNSPPRAEPTQALGTLNLESGQWHTPLFERLGFGRLAWPELVKATQPAGFFQTPHGPIPCYPAVGDHQAALLGAGLSEGELSLNVSTGSQTSLLTPRWQPGEYQTRPFFGGRYLNTITHLPAGRSLNALVDLLMELARGEGRTFDPWRQIAAAVEAVPQTDLDVNLAFFAGSMGDRGHIQEMRLENLSVGHLFRAAFKNMADTYATCATRLSPEHRWQRVVLSGGLPQKLPPLREEIIRRFHCPWRSVDVAEETLQGLLELARQASAR